MSDYDSKFRIGDIISTINDEISDNWLLCNGKVIDKTKYPELYNKTKNEFLTGSWKRLSLSFGNFVDFAIYKDYIIILEDNNISRFDTYDEEGDFEIKMFYTKDISENNFYEGQMSFNNYNINVKIMNSDNLFLIFFISKDSESQNKVIKIYYAKNPYELLNESEIQLKDRNIYINYYGCVNNIFFICITTFKFSYIFYSSFPNEWKKIDFYDNETYAEIRSVLYLNDKYIFFGLKNDYHIWEFENLELVDYSKSKNINLESGLKLNLFYKNGNYILSNGYYSLNGYLGPWIKPKNEMMIYFLNNLFLTFDNDINNDNKNNCIYYGDTPEEIKKNKIETNLKFKIYNTYFGNNYFVVVDRNNNKNIWYLKYGKFLPKINLGIGVNTFIKAK